MEETATAGSRVEVPEVPMRKLSDIEFEELVVDQLLDLRPDDVVEPGMIGKVAAHSTVEEVCCGGFYPGVRAELADKNEIAGLVALLRAGGDLMLLTGGCVALESRQLAIHALLSGLVASGALPAGDYVIHHEP